MRFALCLNFVDVVIGFGIPLLGSTHMLPGFIAAIAADSNDAARCLYVLISDSTSQLTLRINCDFHAYRFR